MEPDNRAEGRADVLVNAARSLVAALDSDTLGLVTRTLEDSLLYGRWKLKEHSEGLRPSDQRLEVRDKTVELWLRADGSAMIRESDDYVTYDGKNKAAKEFGGGGSSRVIGCCHPTYAPSDGVHPGITCDKSGMFPIVGNRYNLIGEDYDLCESEYMQLSDEEKANYEQIAPPPKPRAGKDARRKPETTDAFITQPTDEMNGNGKWWFSIEESDDDDEKWATQGLVKVLHISGDGYFSGGAFEDDDLLFSGGGPRMGITFKVTEAELLARYQHTYLKEGASPDGEASSDTGGVDGLPLSGALACV